jgi:hypothetical protein
MKKPSITCPASQEKINENTSRIVASLVIIIVFIGVYFRIPLLLAALAIDFYLRTFTPGNYSPLKYISKKFSIYASIPEKMADAAPKKFAAGMGLVFSIAIASLLWVNYETSADSLAAVLLVCAGLEAFKGFCLGCIVYTYIVLPFLSKENSEQSTISINL